MLLQDSALNASSLAAAVAAVGRHLASALQQGMLVAYDNAGASLVPGSCRYGAERRRCCAPGCRFLPG